MIPIYWMELTWAQPLIVSLFHTADEKDEEKLYNS